MGDNYVFGENVLRDFLMQLQLLGNDISSQDFQEGIEENTKYILMNMGVHPEDMQYLDFKFKKYGEGHVRLMPKNIVTALWFIGVFPENCETAFLTNSVIYYGLKYKFNKKTKRLTWERIKE